MSLQVRLARQSDLGRAAAVLGGFQAQWYADLGDLAAAYLAQPRHALFVAELDETLVGTAAVKPCLLRTPPNPEWLALRYNRPSVCQLVRVWIDTAARRRGAARELVSQAAHWATEEAGYDTVYLHTDASAPGAEPFWRSMPTIEIYDSRPDPFPCVHFELDVEKLDAGPRDG